MKNMTARAKIALTLVHIGIDIGRDLADDFGGARIAIAA